VTVWSTGSNITSDDSRCGIVLEVAGANLEMGAAPTLLERSAEVGQCPDGQQIDAEQRLEPGDKTDPAGSSQCIFVPEPRVSSVA
jgi:hypothetical protein